MERPNEVSKLLLDKTAVQDQRIWYEFIEFWKFQYEFMKEFFPVTLYSQHWKIKLNSFED